MSGKLSDEGPQNMRWSGRFLVISLERGLPANRSFIGHLYWLSLRLRGQASLQRIRTLGNIKKA
jgi:hypothetical protein